jgi:hypothetical protein
MTKFEVVERKNWVSIGRLSKGRIHYKGKSLIPMRMHSVMGGGLDAAGGVGGAIVGGVLLGGVGALAGGAFGAAGGKVTCLVQVASGEQLLCRTTKSEFPNLHRQLLEAVEAFPRQLEQVSAKHAEMEAKGLPGFSLMQFLLGPFYLLKFNVWHFIPAAAATYFTAGLAWIAMPLWSREVARGRWIKQGKQLAAEIAALKSVPLPSQNANQGNAHSSAIAMVTK